MWLERFQAVDRLLKTLEAYGFIGALDEADFLCFSLNKWKEKNEKYVIRNITSADKVKIIFIFIFLFFLLEIKEIVCFENV